MDVRAAVTHYLAMLSDPDAPDPCRSLWEMGEVTLPYLVEAFERTQSREVQQRIGEVVCQLRAPAALPFLQELLNGSDSRLWKLALDGLVTLGGNPAIRNVVVETLVAARENANADKRAWIDEAIEQVP
jgi:hypothetical protein